VDIGSTRTAVGGTCVNDIVIGWDSVNPRAQVALCGGSGTQYYTPDAFGIITPGVWYHLVVVFTPVSPVSSGLGNWYTYINGQFYSGLGNYPYPPAVVRSWAYLGKSNWGDPSLIAEIDTFNIYNQTLSDVQVTNLYNIAITPGGGSSTGQNGGSSSSLSGGAIAGIVIGSVVGAFIICVLLVCFCRGGSTKGGKGYTDQSDAGASGHDNAHDESSNQGEGVEMTA